MTASPQRGAKIGPRVAHVVSQAIVATHKALLGTKHKLGMALFNSMSDQISDEVHRTVGPYLRDIADHPASSDQLKAAAAFLGTQHGQLTALSGITMVGQSILGSLAEIINNAAAPAVRDAIRVSPNLALDPTTLAQIVAAGIDTESDAIGDVEGQGFNAGQFASMVELAHNYPAIVQSLELYRRGVISADEMNLHFARNGLPSDQWDIVRELAHQPIGAADAALAVLRGNMDMADAVQVAAAWGIDPDSFNILIGNTGEPPAAEELGEALRRGFIDQATYTRGILQSRIRDEWIPTMLALRYSPMSVADAVNAVVQNQLGMSDGEAIAEQNGLEPGQFTTLYNAAGEPLSRGEMFDLYNRGLATEAEVQQAMRESRLKNKYNDLAFNLHQKLPEPRMLAEAVQYGSVTYADAIKYAMDSGYSQQVAQVIVGMGSARKLQTYTDRVAAAVESLYEANAISEAQAQQFFTSLNYTQAEAQFILDASNFRQQEKIVSAAISAIRSKYVARHIDQNTASGYLDNLGVPSAQRDQLLSVWSIEEQANVKVLSEAQIAKAVKDQLTLSDGTVVDETWGLNYLQQLGYNIDDATLLIEGA